MNRTEFNEYKSKGEIVNAFKNGCGQCDVNSDCPKYTSMYASNIFEATGFCGAIGDQTGNPQKKTRAYYV